MYVHTCDWCGRKSTEGAIHNILVGTDSAMKKSLCSEKCASEILEKYGAPTPETEKEWVDYQNEKIAAKKAKEKAKKEEKFQKGLKVAQKQKENLEKYKTQIILGLIIAITSLITCFILQKTIFLIGSIGGLIFSAIYLSNGVILKDIIKPKDDPEMYEKIMETINNKDKN